MVGTAKRRRRDNLPVGEVGLIDAAREFASILIGGSFDQICRQHASDMFAGRSPALILRSAKEATGDGAGVEVAGEGRVAEAKHRETWNFEQLGADDLNKLPELFSCTKSSDLVLSQGKDGRRRWAVPFYGTSISPPYYPAWREHHPLRPLFDNGKVELSPSEGESIAAALAYVANTLGRTLTAALEQALRRGDLVASALTHADAFGKRQDVSRERLSLGRIMPATNEIRFSQPSGPPLQCVRVRYGSGRRSDAFHDGDAELIALIRSDVIDKRAELTASLMRHALKAERRRGTKPESVIRRLRQLYNATYPSEDMKPGPRRG